MIFPFLDTQPDCLKSFSRDIIYAACFAVLLLAAYFDEIKR